LWRVKPLKQPKTSGSLPACSCKRALWKRAAHEIQSPLVAAMGVSPLTSSTYPSNLMILYAVGYVLVALALALRHFNQRDL